MEDAWNIDDNELFTSSELLSYLFWSEKQYRPKSIRFDDFKQIFLNTFNGFACINKYFSYIKFKNWKTRMTEF